MNKKLKIVMAILLIIGFAMIGTGVYLLIANDKHDSIKDKNPIVDNKDNEKPSESKLEKLPIPQITGGTRGELGIDKNINEGTIDKYLNREDSVYRDMRMLEDPGNYEAIGGDRYLSGYIDGFEVIPLPYIIPVTGLPDEVGETYTGSTLFYNDNGTYVANYKESMSIIETIFPKDKVIFLMCGGGGYAGMTRNFLISLGWDENKIYNVGGYWYYKGEHSIDVPRGVNSEARYDFSKVPYHEINFDQLTKTKNYKEPVTKVSELKISTSNITLNERSSFKLNVIVLPNEATNKEVEWTSSDEDVAIVDYDGIVKAIGAGTATITAKSVDGDKIVECEVTVIKKNLGPLVKLDDVSKEALEYAAYDLEKIYDEYRNIIYDSDWNIREGYRKPDEYGYGYELNDLGEELLETRDEEIEEASEKKIEILNKLIDDKKSFVILIENGGCGVEYSILDGAAKILKQKDYPYFELSEYMEWDYKKLKLDRKDSYLNSVAIVKEGELYVTVDLDIDSISSDEEMNDWLSEYIDMN